MTRVDTQLLPRNQTKQDELILKSNTKATRTETMIITIFKGQDNTLVVRCTISRML